MCTELGPSRQTFKLLFLFYFAEFPRLLYLLTACDLRGASFIREEFAASVSEMLAG